MIAANSYALDPAVVHRPATADGMRAVAFTLSRQGLRPFDVAEVLRITVPAVLALLNEDYRA